MPRIRWSIVAVLFGLCTRPLAGVQPPTTVRTATVRVPASRSSAAPAASLSEILSRAGQYVLGFEERFAVVISDEQYDQHVIYGNLRRPPQDRKIESEMTFLWLSSERAWLAVRNVQTVDGHLVSNSEERLSQLLDAGGSIGVPHLRQLRNESTRFNLGSIRRNFNDPMTPLRFLEPDTQARFRFAHAGDEIVNGVPASKVTFNEVARPTFIQGDHPSHGIIWLALDGTVVRTRHEVANREAGLTGAITVSYGRDAKLEMLVPTTMHESYNALAKLGSTDDALSERVECDASYSNFRRFETSGRIVP